MTAGTTNLAQVEAFKYLGRWMTADDTDDRAVRENITKARTRWGQLCRLLTRQGASQQIMGQFYKATIQAVLLFGAETWSLTQPLIRRLCSFHHRCARYLARSPMIQKEDGTWVSPPSATVLEQAGLLTIEEYIARRIATILPFAQSRAIYGECHTARVTQMATNHPCWWTSLTVQAAQAHDHRMANENHDNHDPRVAASNPHEPPTPRRSARLNITE